jgi:SAM-dependent methyltransferase
MPEYWEKRKNRRYYDEALAYVRRFSPVNASILDVGAGTQAGCEYLLRLPETYRLTALEKAEDEGIRHERIRNIFADFLTWKPDGHYDTVICLQCIEHVKEAGEFFSRLRRAGDVLVLSVPYRWRAAACKSHVHDPIDLDMVLNWAGGEQPVEWQVVTEASPPRTQRLIGVWQ